MVDRSRRTPSPWPRSWTRSCCRRGVAAMAVAIVLAGPVAHGDAGLPPELVSGFTRAVQPLLINKCAQGACHGGTAATTFHLRRIPGGRSPDRPTTLENLAAFLSAVGPDRDPAPLVQSLATRHPAAAARNALIAAPLSARERITIEHWLAAVRAVETTRPRHVADPAVIPASATVPALPAGPPRPNRFQTLLDAAANPPQFPPPQEPQGVIRLDDLPGDAPPPAPPPDESDRP
jgi:hypothetical protein